MTESERSKETSAPHPVATFEQEHEIIRYYLGDLDVFIARLKASDSWDNLGQNLDELKSIAHQLLEAESHHQREEEVLFPKLEEYGIVEAPTMMTLDHVEFRKRKQELHQLAHHPQDYEFSEFKTRVIELGGYLSRELESHILTEENVVYQSALEALSPEDWAAIKQECDKLGYCRFTPGYQEKESN